VKFVFAARDERDVVSILRKEARELGAEAAGGAGDESGGRHDRSSLQCCAL
jgi:hypothetical protein